MIFSNPQFWILWLIPGLILLMVFAEIRRKKKASFLIHKTQWGAMMHGPSKRIGKNLMVLLGVIFLLLAWLGPQWGYELKEIKKRGSDIYILVDVSSSMNAQDIHPSRMERAKRELMDLVEKLDGDRVGLIVFAGRAFVFCPLTHDYESFRLFIDELATDLIPIQGTDIDSALKLAMESFEAQNSRAILILTDGEDSGGDIPILEEVTSKGIRIFAMGMGTLEGAPIPAEEGGFKKDSQGNLVISRLNEDVLKKIAKNGRYVRSQSGDADLETVYMEGIHAVLTKQELESGKRQIPVERFQIPLFLALLLLGLEPLIREN